MTQRISARLLAGGLLVGICLTSAAKLSAQPTFVPVGPPTQVAIPLYSSPISPRAAVQPGPVNGGVEVGLSFDGIDYTGSNCGCIPPDTNAAVGNNYVVETVNVQVRVFDKTTAAVLLNKSLSAFFGARSGGDPYVVYDDNADRWYVSAFDSTDTGLFLAVSSDGNPLDPFHVFHLTNVGGFPDYQKLGFNKDAIFISYNNFGPGGGAAANIAAIDKAAALSGTLTYFVSKPKFQFRAMPPAQMHGDKKGGTEWFVSTDGTDTGGSTIRVTEMTNYLSNAPVFEYTSIPVTPYQSAKRADQPGGAVTVLPNTTTTQVQFHKGRLTTAMASSIATDGFVYPKGLFYQIDVNGEGVVKPRLMLESVIDPGPGAAVQMPSVDEDKQGNLGLTWMESSKAEFLSMWVGNHYTNGDLKASQGASGGGPFVVNFRIGDYSTTVLDPDDGRTFWTANEYIGSNGATDIWKTHIASFQAR
jgi:hypothetical protein